MPTATTPVPDTSPAARLEADLRQAIRGEVRGDRLVRALYSTDASIYQITPDLVVFPRDADDVAATVRLCREHRTPLTPRGAGTGLTGAAVNRGVQMDLSRHMNRIIAIDPEARTARVQPGVVLDELNAVLRKSGLQFAPDVATSSRATVGGMIANNSCGARSIVYGRTVDHLLGLDVVLSDGSRATWGRDAAAHSNPLAQRCDAVLAEILKSEADEIAARYPKLLRSNGGYALDRLRPGTARLNTEALLSGSEGTLGIVVEATVNLIPLPRHRGLCVVHYRELLDCLGTVPAILEHTPAAIELLDRMILDATRGHPHYDPMRWFLDGDPDCVLIVEMFGETADELRQKLAELARDLAARGVGYAHPVVLEAPQQADVWEIRKAGTGLLMSHPGETQPYDFIEDSTVEPAKLRDFIAQLIAILKEEGVEQAGFYAHASVGCLHIRPALNLREKRDIQRLRRVGDRVSSLAIRMGGTMTGEHGDGIVRSEWIEKLYGPRLVAAFKRIKQTFDPDGVFNPGKIVDPLPMDQNLREGETFKTQTPLTLLDFSAHGGMGGLATMCSGLGHCRQRLVGTMCPSYVATGDELHTTRARANALRIALSNRDLLDGLSDPALDEVMDLCISCKACKTECPTGVDMARLKAEWLHHRNQHRGVPARSKLVAASPAMAALGSRFAPLSNWVLQSIPVRWLMEVLYGLDHRVPPPKYAKPTFRTWFERRRTPARPASRGRVAYFVDTWTNFHVPSVGRSMVTVLEALGYEVIVPPTGCCGRPAISKGLLDEARRMAEHNIAILEPIAREGIPIVGTEPSCVSAILDEWPQFVRDPAARLVAKQSTMVETFVARELAARPDALEFRKENLRVIYHGHCHQKSLIGTVDALAVLNAATRGHATEINSGCCGMAGSFGHEREHYDVAKAMGEERLFAAVRARGDAEVAVSGFSCRHQLEHHTRVHPRHVIEYLAASLA